MNRKTRGHSARRAATIALTLAFAAGCSASAARGPAAPYPTKGQSEAQRESDTSECDAWAKTEATKTPSQANALTRAGGGALSGAAMGAAIGAASLAIIGGVGAAVGAPVGAVFGGISGAVSSAVGGAVADRDTLRASWRNCMIARGYVVEGSGGGPIATNDLGSIGGAAGALNSLQ